MSTTAPITVSIILPFIARLRASFAGPTLLFRRPRLVIAGGARAMPAAQHGAGRVIRQRRPGHIGLMRLLPRKMRPLARHLVDRVMQPGMPFGRDFRAFRFAVIDDPAPLAAEAATAPPRWPVALEPIIRIAVGVGSDPFAAQPGQESRPECRHLPISLGARTIAPRPGLGKGPPRRPRGSAGVEPAERESPRLSSPFPIYCVSMPFTHRC